MNTNLENPGQIRVRFAPSPTGRLHIGGVRTALFNYLYARQQGGQFLLRIEDTDRERSEKKYEDEILDSLKWLGLEWDGEPVRQSERLARYKQAAAALIAKDLAYEIEGAIKFRMPKQTVKFRDAVRDEVSFDSSLWEDLVIMKRDGYPVFHFAVVVDDHDMGITHVIRGDDHLTNTPKHILLYQAFGWKPPKYAHLPLIMGADGTPLSKRHGAVASNDYREQGYLSQAILNYLALLGWGPEGNEEIFTLPQLVKKFSLKRITKSNARFNPEKFEWINAQHLKNLPDAEYIKGMTDYWQAKSDWPKHPSWQKILLLYKTRAKTFQDLAVQAGYIFEKEINYNPALKTELITPDGVKLLKLWSEQAKSMSFGDFAALEKMTRDLAAAQNVQMGAFVHPLRFAISGTKVTPGLFELMSVMGREISLKRIQKAAEN